ncbi:unnamed protein product [Prorocentrum cordatum]|uniref:Uncharacterized protein n=1 Tax=Prorocentrum cordatum TaxID=2364126 RepID=A0ABN9WEH6_9DINO|nr:unnamed protein product [Polarella glacialis]
MPLSRRFWDVVLGFLSSLVVQGSALRLAAVDQFLWQPPTAMASGTVQAWAWILHHGNRGWQHQRVWDHLRPQEVTPVNELLKRFMTPDADVYLEQRGESSPYYQAVLLASDRRTIPPGIARAEARRFRRPPVAAELAETISQARQAADDLYTQQAAAAGLPAGAPPGGAVIFRAQPPAVMPEGGLEPAAGDRTPAAPLAGGVSAGAAGSQRETVESTIHGPRGTPVALAETDHVQSEVGIFTAPSGTAVVFRDLQAHPVEEYPTMESHHDLRVTMPTILASRDRLRGRFIVSDVQLRESLFRDWPMFGPRTITWCCSWLSHRHGGPLRHHRSLLMTDGVRTDDWGGEVHDTAMRCWDEGLHYNMIDVSNSAAIELVLGRALRVEYVYHMDFLASPCSGPKGKNKRSSSSMDPAHLVDLPAAGSVSRSLEHLACDRGKGIAERLIQLRLPESTGREIAKLEGPARPYSDPALRRSPALYAELLRGVADCDLIEGHLSGEVSCGLFFVYKKSGKYRLIVDGRQPSCHFRDSDPVALASGAAFSAIEVDSAAPVQVGSVDIVNAFYNVQLPEALRDVFVLPRVRADLVNVSTAQGRAVRRGQYFFPVLKVIPMGWKLSLWACQQVLEYRYVDSFFAFGKDREVVRGVAEEVQQELSGVDLPTHPVPEDKLDIDSSIWDGEWRRVSVILEGRNAVLAHLHKTSAMANFGKRHLYLGDAMASILAVSKGRSSSRLMRVCRQIGGLNLAFNMTSRWRWLPSEHNPADRGSRRKQGDWAEASAKPRAPDPPAAVLPRPRHAPLNGDARGQRDSRVRAFAARLGRAFGVDFCPADAPVAAASSEDFDRSEPGLRADLAARRRRGNVAESTVDELGPSLLGRRTEKKYQEARCERIVGQLCLWCAAASRVIDSATQLVSAVTAYLHALFFQGYLRSVVTFLLVALAYCQQDLSPKGPRALAMWTLRPFESECSTPPRTGGPDKPLSHDNTVFCWVGGLLSRLRAGRGATPPLLDLKCSSWAALFSQAAVDVGLGSLGPPTLCQLRHSGAIHGLATRARPLAEIKKRGRRASDSSVGSHAAQRQAHTAAARTRSQILRTPLARQL